MPRNGGAVVVVAQGASGAWTVVVVVAIAHDGRVFQASISSSVQSFAAMAIFMMPLLLLLVAVVQELALTLGVAAARG